MLRAQLMLMLALALALVAGCVGAGGAGGKAPQDPERDYYSTLGVPTDATESDIKKAYRALAKIWHPDKRPDTPDAEDTFVGIVEAYEVLSDPEQRTWYDNTRGSGGRQKIFPRGKSGARGASGFSGGFNVGGMNRLIFASMMGDARKVEKLLKAGRAPKYEPWDLDEQAFMGFTALHWACKKKSLDTATLLVEAGANVDAKLMAAPRGGNAKAGLQTPLMIAAKAGQEKIVALLLKHNADPALRAGDGKTAPIDFACEEVQAASKRKPIPLAMREYLANLKTLIGYLLEADAKRHAEAPAVLPRDRACLAMAGISLDTREGGAAGGALTAPAAATEQQQAKGKKMSSSMDLSLFRRLLSLDKQSYAHAEEAQIVRWFGELDVDGDGGVDNAEFKALASVVAGPKDEL